MDTLWSILAWVIVGGVAGWLASIIMKRNQQQGLIMNIVIGILGAIVGGWGYSLLSGATFSIWSWTGLIVAVIGAVVLLAIYNLLFNRNKA